MMSLTKKVYHPKEQKPEGFASLREKFYHPINKLPRPPRAEVPYHLYIWVVLALMWIASARSDASVLFT